MCRAPGTKPACAAHSPRLPATRERDTPPDGLARSALEEPSREQNANPSAQRASGTPRLTEVTPAPDRPLRPGQTTALGKFAECRFDVTAEKLEGGSCRVFSLPPKGGGARPAHPELYEPESCVGTTAEKLSEAPVDGANAPDQNGGCGKESLSLARRCHRCHRDPINTFWVQHSSRARDGPAHDGVAPLHRRSLAHHPDRGEPGSGGVSRA